MSNDPNERDYELIARWLDGEPVELSDRQRRVADEIAGDERALGPTPKGRLPDGVRRKAMAPVRRALAWRAMTRKLVPLTAAAAVLVAVGLLWQAGVGPGEQTPQTPPIAQAPTDANGDAGRPDAPDAQDVTLADVDAALFGSGVGLAGREQDGELAELDESIDELQAELMAVTGEEYFPLDAGLDAIERTLDGFWNDDATPGRGDT
jgi:hypothetical protein